MSCPFCGSASLTQTLIWPEWLSSVIPRETRSIGSVDINATDHLEEKHQMRARIACEFCDNGWIQRVRTRVFPFIEQIIKGNFRRKLTLRETEALAAWLASTVALLELGSLTSKAIGRDELSSLQRTELPTNGWSIFLAEASGPRWSRLRRYHNFWVADEKPEDELSYNTQITTIGIGRLFVQAFTTPVAEVSSLYRRHAQSLGMDRLWPPRAVPSQRVSFPLSLRLTDDSADDIEHAGLAFICGL
jgi:hypothetical protein